MSGHEKLSQFGRIVWNSKNEFQIDGTNFFASIDPAVYSVRKSTEESLLIVKNREMIESELQLSGQLECQNIVDLGVWQGGSVALLDSLFCPDKLVAIEYSDIELPALDSYIKKKNRSSHISLNKGVNQADQSAVKSILDREFGTNEIDLVVDDASHLYEETKASFDLIFPRVRENGLFIIEDWQWSTMPDHYDLEYFRNRKGLLNLVMQCTALCACRPDIVSQVLIFPHAALITRGGADLSGDFDIESLALNKGEPVPLVF